jgi:NTP pyrophosphatase (non-canonical NTP hydrolase)
MTISEYKVAIKEFATYNDKEYPKYLLIEEVGEYFGKIAKEMRGDVIEGHKQAKIKELGDIAWAAAEISNIAGVEIPYIYNAVPARLDILDYVTACVNTEYNNGQMILILFRIFKWIESESARLGTNAEHVFLTNIEKLQDRKARNVINGSGDNR